MADDKKKLADELEEVRQLSVMYRIQLDAITLLLVEKGLIKRDELFQKFSEVEADYRQKGLLKK